MSFSHRIASILSRAVRSTMPGVKPVDRRVANLFEPLEGRQMFSASLGLTSLTVGPTAGGASDILLESVASTAWTVSTAASWLHITTASGTGSSLVKLTYDANATTAPRSGTYTIGGLTLSVTQAPTGYVGATAAGAIVPASTLGSGAQGITQDSAGDIYFSEVLNPTTNQPAIMEYVPSTGVVSTVVSSAALSQPEGVAVDGSGNVFIADYGNNAIKEFSATTKTLSTIYSSANDAAFLGSGSVATDSAGNLYFPFALYNPSTGMGDAVMQWSATTHTVSTFNASAPLLDEVQNVAVDALGNVYADSGQFSSTTAPAIYGNNVVKLAAASPHTATVLIAGLSSPGALTVDGGGNIYINDNGGTTEKVWNASTSALLTLDNVPSNGLIVDAVGNIDLADANIDQIPKAYAGPATTTVGPALGTGTLGIVSPDTTLGNYFTPTSNQPWLTVGAISGSTINYSYTATPSVLSRSAIISALGQSFTVTQTGTAVVGNTGLTVAAAAGTSSVTLGEPTTATAWAATSNATWLTIPTASGTGSSTVNFAVTANTGAARTGTLTIGGLAVTVTQAGATYSSVSQFLALSTTAMPGANGVAFDSAGNVFVADAKASSIQEWTASTGVVTTIVSTGLNAPDGIAIDSAGNLFIADTGNSAIKEWAKSTGVVSSLVSTGLLNPYGVAVDSSGNVYIADTGNNAVKKWTKSSNSVSSIVSTGLSGPDSVSVDVYGDVYIADTKNNAVKEWNLANGLVTSLVSTGLTAPTGVAVSLQAGVYDFYITDGSGAVYRYVATSKSLTSLASGFANPGGLAVDAAGDVYVADTGHFSLKEITGGGVSTLLSPNPYAPYLTAIDLTGDVFFSDSGNNVIKEWKPATNAVTTVITGLNNPSGIALDAAGNLFIADTGNNAIEEWTASNNTVTTLASGLKSPTGVAVDASQNVYFSDTGNNAVKEISQATGAVSTIISTGLVGPTGISLDNSANLYIADTGDNAVKKFTAATGAVSTLVSTGLVSPHGVSVDGSGNVFIADTGDNAIKKFTVTTSAVSTVISTGLTGPDGVTVDRLGNLYIADTGNNAVEELAQAIVGPATTTLAAAASTGSLSVLPATENLAAPFAPVSNAAWLTITSVSGGSINYAATTNSSGVTRTATITVLGTAFTFSQPAAVLTTSFTSIGVSPTNVTYGGTVTITISVSPAGKPTGTVTLMNGTAVLGTVTLVNGAASFQTTLLAVSNTSPVTAVYSGDSTYGTSTSSASNVFVFKGTTTNALTASATSAAVGQSVTFTSTLATGTGGGVETGVVTFMDGAATLGTGTITAGVATFTTTSLALGTHSITAVYGGDSNVTGSTSSALTETIATATSTALGTSNAAPTFGQSVTLTATLTPSAVTGTVTFKDGATTLGTGTISGGVATFTTTALSVGSHSITAVFGGATGYAASTSTAVTETVAQASTTATLSSLTSAGYGQNITFTATLAAVAPGAGVPTGTVTFKDGNTTLGTGTLSGGVAMFSTTTLAPGTHSITAIYAGSTNFAASTSSAGTQTITQASTTTTLTTSAASVISGTTVTFTATLSSTLATGTVTFKDGATTLGTGTVTNGIATYATAALGLGSHSITAIYSGDTNFTGSTSTALTQKVGVASTTSLTSTSATTVFGQSVTFTATLSPAAATGTVTFMDGATTLGTGTIASGVATFTTTGLTTGSHSITAVYGSDNTDAASTSSALTETVSQASTTAVLGSISSTTFGQSVTFTATLSAVSPGAGTPTGTVTFMDGQTTLGTGTLTAGVATFSTTAQNAGSHSITAVYGGDTNFATSTSSAATETVSQITTTTGLTTTATTIANRQTVTFTATLSTTAATGTVTFMDGAATLGTGTISAGVATFTTTALNSGSNSITAVYGGDTNYTGSTSVAVTVNVVSSASIARTTILESSAAASDADLLTEINPSATWTAVSDSTWLTVTTASGTGTSNVIFSYTANTTGAPRTGNITVDGQNIAVTQAPSTYAVAGTQTLATGLVHPFSPVVDSAGNVFFLQTGGTTVQKWSPATNAVTTVVTGIGTTSSLAIDGSDNLYIADSLNGVIEEWSPGSGMLKPAISGISGLTMVAADAVGDIYYGSDSGIYEGSTLKATPTGGNDLTALAVTTTGNILYGEAQYHLLGDAYFFANGSGAGYIESTYTPNGITADAAGNFFAANSAGIHKITTGFTFVSPAAPALFSLNASGGIARDASGNFYTTDATNGLLVKWTPSYVGPSSVSVGFAGGSGTLNVLSPITSLSGAFAPVSSQPWLTINSAANGQISYTAGFNPNSTARSATITVLGTAITVTEAAQPGSTTKVTSSANPVAPGGSATYTATVAPVTGTTTATGTVTFSDGATTLGTSTLVNGVATYTASGLTLGSHVITAVYSGDTNIAISTGTFTESVVVFSSSLGTTTLNELPTAGTDSDILVESIPTLTWTAVSNTSWLHVPAGSASGTGSALVTFTFDANTTPVVRTGTLTIGGKTLTVTQAPAGSVAASQFGVIQTYAQIGKDYPEGTAIDAAGNVYFVTDNKKLEEWSPATQTLKVLSTALNVPDGIAVDAAGDIYIADYGPNTLQEWSAATQSLSTVLTAAQFGGKVYPDGVAIDSAGNVYVLGYYDVGGGYVHEWSPTTQTVTALIPTGLSSPFGIAIDSAGNLYFAGYGNQTIQEWSPSAQALTTLISTGTSYPLGVTVDGSGNVFYSVYSSSGANSIYEWSPNTQASTLLPATVEYGAGLALDSAGNLYVTDDYVIAGALNEIARAIVGPAATAALTAGTGALTLLSPNQTLAAPFAPTSSQSWLTLGTIGNGQLNYSFTANATGADRTAVITVLGQAITVTQSGAAATTPVNTTTALSTNVTRGVVGQSITFTATVTPASGTTAATGTVTFMDGSTVLGTGSLVNGIATFTTTSLNQAVHSITAVYGGDTGDLTSTSSAISVLIRTDVTAAAAIVRSGFRLTRGTALYTQTVTITNNSGAAWNGPITLALYGLPTGVSLSNTTFVGGSEFTTTGSLAAGATLTLTLTFTNPTNVAITYNAAVLLGTSAIPVSPSTAFSPVQVSPLVSLASQLSNLN